MSKYEKTCLICNEQLLYYKGLDEHLLSNHNMSYEDYYIKHFLKESILCPVCNKEKVFDLNIRRYRDTCGDKNCIKSLKVSWSKNEIKRKERQQKTEKTKLLNHGNSKYNNRDKFKKTCIEKYDVENVFQIPEIKSQIEQTHLKNLGVTHPSKSAMIKEKKKQTNLRNRKVENPMQDKSVMAKGKATKLKAHNDENYNNPEKARQTKEERYEDKNYGCFGSESFERGMLKNHRVKNAKQSKEVQEGIEQRRIIKFFNNKILKLTEVIPLFTINDYTKVRKLYKWKCNKCLENFEDTLQSGKIPRCPNCYPPLQGSSYIQKEIYDWLKQYVNVFPDKRFAFKENNKRRAYELDIYIESKNIGIELNGIYHHSENGGYGKTDKNYHLNKTNFFKEKGIQVLHFWDIEWLEKKERVQSIILSKLGIYETKLQARKCVIKEISSKEANEFLNNTHIQGKCNTKVNIGLFYKEELVQLVSFGKSRYNKNYDYELLRFSSKLNTTVIGGFAKLLKYFKDNYRRSIISYCDLRYSIGNIYLNNGFILQGQSSPNYFYTKDYKKLESRIGYQKHKLSKILKTFDPNLTEWENMQLNKYDRIFDCGNLIFVLP